jgi:hypothetical protein
VGTSWLCPRGRSLSFGKTIVLPRDLLVRQAEVRSDEVTLRFSSFSELMSRWPWGQHGVTVVQLQIKGLGGGGTDFPSFCPVLVQIRIWGPRGPRGTR